MKILNIALFVISCFLIPNSQFPYLFGALALLALIPLLFKIRLLIIASLLTLLIFASHYLWTNFWHGINLNNNVVTSNINGYFLQGKENYQKVFPLLVLGIRNQATQELYDLSRDLGVAHILVISGFHISLIYIFLFRLFFHFHFKTIYASSFSLGILFAYIALIGFPISALRAFVFTVIYFMSKDLKIAKLSSIDALAITLLAFAIVYPSWVPSFSFILTFIASFAVLFASKVKFKNKVSKMLFCGVCAYLSTLPIIIYISHKFVVLAFLFGNIFTPFYLIYYVVNVSLFPFKDILDYIDYSFIFCFRSIDTISFSLTVPKFDAKIIVCLYVFVTGIPIIKLGWNYYLVMRATSLSKKLKK